MVNMLGGTPGTISESSQPGFHILAISGGGFRGLYAATVLKNLEAALGSPLARYFDLLCGTSVGGLLALGLAAEIPAADLQTMFTQHGRRIFHCQDRFRRFLRPWFSARHPAHGLRTVLTELFGTRTMGDLAHRTLVPAVNFRQGKGHFFKTPHVKHFEMDHRLSLVDVGLATTAAPTYLPLHDIPDHGVFVDGGLFGNAPGLFGVHEATHFLGADEESVRLLAIGTMNVDITFPGSAGLNRGIADWRSELFDLTLAAQDNSTHEMLRHRLGDRYVRVNDVISSSERDEIWPLDRVSPAAIRILGDRGTHAARRTLGDPAFAPFSGHRARGAVFFHGRHKSKETRNVES